LKASLLKVLDALSSDSAADECRDMLQIIDTYDSPISEEDFQLNIDQIRNTLLYISQSLRGVKTNRVQIQPLCDTLVLIARTKTYFTPTDY